MRLTFITDPHLGNHRKFGGALVDGVNLRALAVASAIDTAADTAKTRMASTMIVCGDLFDTDKPSPALVALAASVLAGVDCALLVGNHDRTAYQDARAGEHALLPIEHMNTHARHAIVSKAQIIAHGEVFAVPALPRADTSFVSRIRDMIDNNDDFTTARTRPTPTVLCVHAGVMDASTPAFLRSTSALELNDLFDLMDAYGISLAVCGDWHEFKEYERNGRRVVQLGALVPTGFDNPGPDLYGRVLTYDTKTHALVYDTVPGPRFLKMVYEEDQLDAEWVKQNMRGSASDDQIYLSVRALAENVKHARADLEEMKKQGCIAGYEASPSKEMARAQMKAAATRASSASAFEEALDAYLKVTPLPEGATRAGVTQKVTSLLSYKAT